MDTDIPVICSWVRTRQVLQLVSGDAADFLTPALLSGWLARAQIAIVVADEVANQPAGFCTLSCLEVPHLPASYVEICHLIVAPEFRHLFIGSRLVRAAKSLAHDFGYRFVCCRVTPTNKWALALARAQGFQEFTNIKDWLPHGFRWFRFALVGSTNTNTRTEHL